MLFFILSATCFQCFSTVKVYLSYACIYHMLVFTFFIAAVRTIFLTIAFILHTDTKLVWLTPKPILLAARCVSTVSMSSFVAKVKAVIVPVAQPLLTNAIFIGTPSRNAMWENIVKTKIKLYDDSCEISIRTPIWINTIPTFSTAYDDFLTGTKYEKGVWMLSKCSINFIPILRNILITHSF